MRNILIILLICLLHGTAFAGEYLSHDVNCHGNKIKLDFLIQDDVVFVDAVALSKALHLNYSFDLKRKTFLVQQRDSNRRYVFFKGNNVAFNYLSLTTSLQLPASVVFEEEKIFIPFDFFLKIFNSSYRFSPDELYVTRPERTSLDAIDTLLDGNYLFDIYDDFNIDRTLGNFYIAGSEIISTINSLMQGNWGKSKYLLMFHYKDIVEKDRINQLVQLLIPTQSFELLQDEEQQRERTSNLLFASGYLLDAAEGGALRDVIEGTRRQTLNEAVSKLDAMYATHIRMHGTSMPKDMEALHKNIDLLTKESSVFKHAKMGMAATSKIFDTILGAAEFINRNELVLAGLSALCKHVRHIDHALSDATYDQIQIETTSYDAMHKRMLKKFFEFDLISEAVSRLLPPTGITALLWDVASEQFVSSLIEGADNYILATYGTALSYDMANTVNYLQRAAFSGTRIDEDRLNELAALGYLLAKTYYVTRELGLTSNFTVSSAVQKEQKRLHEEVRTLLADIGKATYGYLPQDEAAYLQQYDDTKLIDYLLSGRLSENPLLGVWHAKMQALGSTVVFPIVFTEKTIFLYGKGGRPRTAPALYKRENQDWFFSDNSGKSWQAVSFQDKNTFVMTQKGFTVVCTKVNKFSKDTNPLLGKWHARMKTFGSTVVFPITFSETAVKLHKPEGTVTIPVTYKTENNLWLVSDDNGKSWQPASVSDDGRLVILIRGFSFTCTRVSYQN